MVGYHTLGNGGANGIGLCSDTTSTDANANIQVAELVLSNDQHRFVNLVSKSFWFEQFQWLTIDLDQTAPLLSESNGCGSLFPVKAKEKAKEKA